MNHRRKFACSWNTANRPDEGRRVRFIVCFVHLPTLAVFEVKRFGPDVMKVSDQRRRAEGASKDFMPCFTKIH